MTLNQKAFENIVGEGENAGNQHFFHFPYCFYCIRENIILIALNLLCANGFYLVTTKILLFAKGSLNAPCSVKRGINPLPHMPILGSSNSAANKDMMSKIWTNADTII